LKPERVVVVDVRKLARFAEAYMAPEREGVLRLSGKEKTALRHLCSEVLADLGNEDEVRDFFVSARRWADERMKADRMNASFVRAHYQRIKTYRRQTRADEKLFLQRRQEEAERKRLADVQSAHAERKRRARTAYDGLGRDEKAQVAAEAAQTAGVRPEDPIKGKVWDMLVRETAWSIVAAKLEDSDGEDEET